MKNGKPQISVVIPAFNEEKYLPSCLESIKRQTFRNFELIVVDNNSTDKTAQIARNYGARVVLEKTQGMIPSRQRGFREAAAEIIARTDADTIVKKDWLEVIYKSFMKYPDIIAITGPCLSSTKKIPDYVFKEYSTVISVKMGKFFAGHVYLLGPNMALKKSSWEKLKVNTDDKKVHEDIDLSYHLGKIGKIKFIPRMQVEFSLRKISENPLKGLMRYLGEYPVRYIKTLYINDPEFYKKIMPKLKKRKFKLSSINKLRLVRHNILKLAKGKNGNHL